MIEALYNDLICHFGCILYRYLPAMWFFSGNWMTRHLDWVPWTKLRLFCLPSPATLRRRKPLVAHIRRKDIMEVPVGKCSSCGNMIPMWRCGDTTGGGTYHIVCFECSQRESRQSVQSTVSWHWILWIFVTGIIIGSFFVFLVFVGY